MGWTDPITVNVGDVAHAADWNTYIRDNEKAIRSVESIHHIGTTPFERWYSLGVEAASSPTTNAFTVNQLLAWPFTVARSGATIDRLSINVLTLGTGSKARVGIYQATSDTNIYPLNLVVDGGEFDTATTGVKTATVSVALTPHVLYWACYVCSATSPTIRTYSSVEGFPTLCGVGPTMGGSIENILNAAFTYAALPSTYPTGVPMGNLSIPMVAARYSA